MRVITGTARGRALQTLKGEDIVRPTSQKIKEAMFSAVQFYVAGARVLDLYAGSGQLGVEALSRGAQRCTFIDSDREAVDIIKLNLQKTKLYDKARVLTADARRFLAGTKDSYDLVFVDPPYHKGTVGEILPLLEKAVSPSGFVLCETEADCTLPDAVGTLEQKKTYKHGQTKVWLYRNNIEPDFLSEEQSHEDGHLPRQL